MGVEKIVEKISQETDEKVRSILNDARSKAEKILARAKMQSERKKADIVEKGEREAFLEKQRIIADARIKTRKMKWDAGEEIINKAFESSKKRINEIRSKGRYGGSDYSEILKRLIKEAGLNIGGGDLIVSATKEDAKFIEKGLLDDVAKEIEKETKVKTSITLSEDNISGLGGVIVKTKDRKMEVDNTYEERIRRQTEALRAEVHRILFE
ncbi:MAG: V-type ATP synthase subunit E [Candidatus Hydrothermarchaeota archaeon]